MNTGNEIVEKKEKLKTICDTTLRNCINTKKRLNLNDLFSKFILSYYSVFLIILTITGKYFEKFNDHLSEYFGIIISVVLLVFSLINSNSKYEIRVIKLDQSINNLKTLKRNISDIKDEKGIIDSKESYNKIVDKTEMRSDLDFFKTVKELHLERGISRWNFYINPSLGATAAGIDDKLKEYRSALNVMYFFIRELIVSILRLIILLIPIFITVMCIIID